MYEIQADNMQNDESDSSLLIHLFRTARMETRIIKSYKKFKVKYKGEIK
ncbi:Uncharacterized protein dnm_058570 [Desulfonema magnum]|uniref:Uncharacterized protein n=1 Tax=Desulfonema magnum TaxID=45655 RepID=A0A975BRL8_9BACT|nr:Uncharacterized protein dnm_058570 [Desulfonema magnum]